jgi:hypothetical protein
MLSSAHASASIPPRLTLSAPGDACEQEADRISEQVMQAPEPQLQRACSCGGGCPDCQTEQNKPLRMQRSSVSHGGRIAAPPIVQDVLAASGHPLDATTQGLMEHRFGYDLSQVRVHSDASAELSARSVSAHAYTVGHHIVFGAGQFAPGTAQGQRLIAHELTHVVQQSRSPLPLTAAIRPGLVQRQKDDAKPTVRAKVEEAMKNLKTKFGLAEVTEENGAMWSVSELAKVDAAFSRVGKEDQPLLKGLQLVRTDKFEPLVRKEDTFKVTGKTFGVGTIKLAKEAFQGTASTILHEVGHLIQNKVAAAMLGKSKATFDLEVAKLQVEESRKKTPTRVRPELKEFIEALNQVTTAAGDLMYSGEADRAANQAVLDEAKTQAIIARFQVEQLKSDDVAMAWLELHDRQQKWVEALEKYLEEKGKKNLTGFIDVVTKHNLARKGYAPFTDYVAAHWPTEPEEFFAQSFHTWRTSPDYMKRHMKPLFDWFEKGGHREGKGYLEGRSFLDVTREVAPVLYELGREAKETFWPQDLIDATIFGNQ